MRFLRFPRLRGRLLAAVAVASTVAAIANPLLAREPLSGPVCRETRAPSPTPAPCCAVVSSVRSRDPAPGWLLEPTVQVALGALRSVIDPATGRLLVPRRPTLELSRRTLESFRVPHGDLDQRPLPGGGWKLGLHGRALHPLFATLGPERKPLATHTWEPVTQPTMTAGAEDEDSAGKPESR